MAKLLRAARPQFLIASLALFIMGASWAILLGAPFSLPRLLLSYLIIASAQLSVSYSNGYFDAEVDQHGNPSLFSGGSRILADDPKARKTALRSAIALICCSMGLGILFQVLYSFPLWFLGYVAAGNLLGWFYSAPPLRLAYRGLGEISTAFTAACLIPGMGYLSTWGYFKSDGLLVVTPLLLYGLVFILAVEIPDMEADRQGMKMTWVARRGRMFGFTAVGILLLLATGFFLSVPSIFSHRFPLDFRLPGLFSVLPLGPGIFGMMKRPAERRTATRLVNVIIIAMAIFFILSDAYLIFLAAR